MSNYKDSSGNYKNLGNYKPAAGSSGNTFARVVKKVDEIVSNSTTMQDDDELKVTLNINKAYGYILFLTYSLLAASDFKYDFAVPSGAIINLPNSGYAAETAKASTDATTDMIHVSTSAEKTCLVMGRIVMSSTAGDVQFRWAQNTAVVENTKVLAGSMLIVWEETA